ncbi:zinc transporter ZIP1 [Anabrus simplex]|uniref:zinc transporter ZIP1 n=1 Tax=Anabrus simplex TaxID=316456 RepID=UPI0035A28153
MELTSTKIVVLTLLGAIRLFFGLVPLKITKRLQLWGQQHQQGIPQLVVQQRHAQVDLSVSLCLCFGGGVLLATCFIHMIPEVREYIEAVKGSDKSLLPSDSEFPYAELFVCIGFFLVYIIEEIAHKYFLYHNKSEPKSSNPLPQEREPCSTVEMELNKTEEKKEPEPLVVSAWTRSKSSTRIVPATSQVHLLASNLSLDEKDLKTPAVTSIQCLPKPPVPHHHHVHHHHMHHHHHHTVSGDAEESLMGHLRSALVVLALSFHSVFEGLAIGLQRTERGVWYLFTAVSIHACAILFCVGMELVMSGMKFVNMVIYVVVLSVMSPLGVMFGILATIHGPGDDGSQSLVVAVLQGIAGGTILYITFFEVLDREKKRETGSSSLRLLFTLVGFALMVALEAAGGHEHEHGNPQSHEMEAEISTSEAITVYALGS